MTAAEKKLIPVMEHFYTIQGEGLHAGKAAYFIRLGGCDVGCVWCDVKESWDAEKHPLFEVKSIVNEAEKSPSRICVVTGGEPLMHDCSELTSELKNRNFATHIETSGTSPLSGTWDWICFSPKKFKAPLKIFYTESHELKIIIYSKHDFEWAETHAKKINKSCKLFLQPEWSKATEIIPLITDYIMKYPKWQISLQQHKYMNIP